MTSWLLALVLAQVATPGEASVLPELVCAAQHAVRWRESAWTPRECSRVAGALGATPSPRLLAAVCLNESDFRPGAATEFKPGVYDVGLCGVRCVLPGAGRGGYWTPAGAPRPTRLPRARCTNGPARGLTVRQLQDPVVNVRVASLVLASKNGDLGSYNGATGERKRERYSRKIAALVAALGGVEVPVRGRRLRAMVRKVAAAAARVAGPAGAELMWKKR